MTFCNKRLIMLSVYKTWSRSCWVSLKAPRPPTLTHGAPYSAAYLCRDYICDMIDPPCKYLALLKANLLKSESQHRILDCDRECVNIGSHTMPFWGNAGGVLPMRPVQICIDNPSVSPCPKCLGTRSGRKYRFIQLLKRTRLVSDSVPQGSWRPLQRIM